MGIRTGKQYMDGLRSRKPEVWLDGQKVENLADHPHFQQPIREIARLYDMQVDPQFQDRITHVCEETGERVSNAFLRPRNYDDLRARRELFDVWANATYGLMGRSPDFLNVTVTSLACNTWYFEKFNPQWAENISNYYKYIRDNDLFLTHAIINPQNDRSKASHQQEDPFMHLGIVEETSEGLVLRGAKMLATHAAIADEVIVYPFPGLVSGDEKHALAFAVPMDAPGLRVICREKTQDGTRSYFDHPLASRFEEMDAVLVFHDVLIPWERVFLYGNVEAANFMYLRTGLWQQPAHQTGARGLVKLSLAAAVAAKVAEAIGVDKYLNVQTQLGELIAQVESIRALLISAEHNFEVIPSGEARPAAQPLDTIRTLLPRAYPKAVETIQIIGAGGLLMSPTAADINNPLLRDDIDKYYSGRPGVSGIGRVQLFKLAWDLCGEAFGQRLVQYERYYAGDPVRMIATRYTNYPKNELFAMVDRVLEDSVKLEEQRSKQHNIIQKP